MRATTKEQGFYSQIFKLVLPIVIQNLLSAAVNSADVVMLNYVGQSAISAVSLASNYANVLFMVYYGLGTGATLLCAQYFGKGNMRAIQTGGNRTSILRHHLRRCGRNCFYHATDDDASVYR